MGRYEKYHSVEELGIAGPLSLPVHKTVIRDNETGERAEGLDWDSFRESDRKAWEELKKDK